MRRIKIFSLGLFLIMFTHQASANILDDIFLRSKYFHNTISVVTENFCSVQAYCSIPKRKPNTVDQKKNEFYIVEKNNSLQIEIPDDNVQGSETTLAVIQSLAISSAQQKLTKSRI